MLVLTTMRLVIGPLNYSSWSLRPWLALDHAGANFKTHEIALFVDPDYRDKILQFSGAGKVPILVDGSLSVHESLAICEYVAEQFPAAKLWPRDSQLRARARAVSAEMSTSFSHVRNEMPMNCRGRAQAFTAGEGVASEIARVRDIWRASLSTSHGPYLFGDFSIADCMYMPVLSRFRTYGIGLDGVEAAWEHQMWRHPSVIRWVERARESPPVPHYDAFCD
ncbi:MAG: glutathione S-transferase family protein [Polyangiales bacterium]